jgi:hypothetical protein
MMPWQGSALWFFPMINEGLACLVHNANIDGSGVKIDSAVVFVLFGVKSHWASSFGWNGLWRKP